MKRLVGDFGSGQGMAAGLSVPVPVLELEHAFAAAACASALPSERLAIVHRLVLAPELVAMIGCGSDPDGAIVTVSFLD